MSEKQNATIHLENGELIFVEDVIAVESNEFDHEFLDSEDNTVVVSRFNVKFYVLHDDELDEDDEDDPVLVYVL